MAPASPRRSPETGRRRRRPRSAPSAPPPGPASAPAAGGGRGTQPQWRRGGVGGPPRRRRRRPWRVERGGGRRRRGFWARALGIARRDARGGEKNVGQRADELSLRRRGRRRAARLIAAIARRHVGITRLAGLSSSVCGTGGRENSLNPSKIIAPSLIRLG